MTRDDFNRYVDDWVSTGLLAPEDGEAAKRSVT
jgi:hypothetical protein